MNLPNNRSDLKRFLIKHNLLPYKCECGIENIWRDKKITLQLDHINGVGNDNRLENLRFLCPNCHSQTETFCQQKRKKSIRYSELCEKVISIIDECCSCREVLLKLGMSDHSSQYQKIYRVFTLLGDNEKIKSFKERQLLRRHEPRFNLRKIINRPSKEELQKLVWSKPTTQITQDFGLGSPNTILNWCREYGISKPKRGYWMKQK